jgi:hypothetical protein
MTDIPGLVIGHQVIDPCIRWLRHMQRGIMRLERNSRYDTPMEMGNGIQSEEEQMNVKTLHALQKGS